MFQYWTALGLSEPLMYPGALGAVLLSRKLISPDHPSEEGRLPAFFREPGTAKGGLETIIEAIQKGVLHLL